MNKSSLKVARSHSWDTEKKMLCSDEINTEVSMVTNYLWLKTGNVCHSEN